MEGTLNGSAFQATLEPDGQGGHWLKVDRKLREAAGAASGMSTRERDSLRRFHAGFERNLPGFDRSPIAAATN